MMTGVTVVPIRACSRRPICFVHTGRVSDAVPPSPTCVTRDPRGCIRPAANPLGNA
jgi:hypothetical protein